MHYRQPIKDFLVVGGGIFGLSTAIALAQRGYQVQLINPDTIPHLLAASTDISKVVRMEYGGDLLYARMAQQSMDIWKEWNVFFKRKLYHEVGFLLLCQMPWGYPQQHFEWKNYRTLTKLGYHPQVLTKDDIKKRFPAVNSLFYRSAYFNPIAGYVESSLVLETLATYAQSLGVKISEYQTAHHLLMEQDRVVGVQTKEGRQFTATHTILAVGAHTTKLLPELTPYIKATGHPVFWLKPSHPNLFKPEQLPVFGADIANTGWYGFPFADKHGVIKVAKHSDGITIDPDADDRVVSAAEIIDMRYFLRKTFPSIAKAPLVYTRRCLYTDTLDGHFWIDQHPQKKGLTVSTGGSGHAMKMGPMLGTITADAIEGKTNPFAHRFKWRHINPDTKIQDGARHQGKRIYIFSFTPLFRIIGRKNLPFHG